MGFVHDAHGLRCPGCNHLTNGYTLFCTLDLHHGVCPPFVISLICGNFDKLLFASVLKYLLGNTGFLLIGVLSVLVVVWFPEIGWPLRMYELI